MGGGRAKQVVPLRAADPWSGFSSDSGRCGQATLLNLSLGSDVRGLDFDCERSLRYGESKRCWRIRKAERVATTNGPSWRPRERMEGTYCFIDMAGFTALTEAHGDETAADLAGRFAALVGDAARSCQGRLVTTIGDGAFVLFPRPEDGVRFVVQLFAVATSELDFPVLRVGLHHGAAVEREGTFYGAAVNLAARIASRARGSQVLATSMVANAARDQGIAAESVGTFHLRNVREPVELFALTVEAADHGAVIDPVCRMSLQPDGAVGRFRYRDADYWFCSVGCAESFANSPEEYLLS